MHLQVGVCGNACEERCAWPQHSRDWAWAPDYALPAFSKASAGLIPRSAWIGRPLAWGPQGRLWRAVVSMSPIFEGCKWAFGATGWQDWPQQI